MLELIFQGFAEWLYGMVLECWEYFSSVLLDIMSLDFAYLKAHIPIINDIMQVVLAVGWALLLGNLVFQAIKSMLFGLGFEGEDPKLLFARTFVFAFLLLASPQICEIGLNITSTIMDLLQVPTAVNVHLVDDSVFGSLAAAWLLVIIFDLVLMFEVLKLLLEIAERYVILSMLTITAPLAFATGGSRNTSAIFAGWCRMYGSMCMLMCINVIFFKLLLSVVSAVPSGLDVFPWMVLILAIVKVAKKADAIVTRIGLNPAITGDSLGSRLPGMLTYAVVRTVASSITKSAKKSTGGTNRGRATGFSPGGGGPRSGGPFGGRGGPGMGATVGLAGQSGPQSSTTQQGSNYQQGSTQQGAAYQRSTQMGTPPGTTQPSGQQPPPKGQTGGVTLSSTTSQAGCMGGQFSRKSSVPSGTHRSPSHVTTSGGPIFGTPAPSGPGAPSQAAAGMPPKGGASSKPGMVRLGTAGKSSPGVITRFTQVYSQRAQDGDSAAKVQAAEQTAISAGQKQPPSGVVHPGSKTLGVSPDQKAQPGQATRFTQRESREVKGGQAPAASQAAKTAPTTSGVQPGTAGTGAAPTVDHSARVTRHGRDSSPPVGSTAHIPQTVTSPARQESGKAAEAVAPSVKGSSAQTRPSTAGTAPTVQQAAQPRQTARGQTLRAKSTPTATDSLGGKRAASTASAVEKGRIMPKGPVPPKAQHPTRKRADRPPRKGGGDKRGK